MPETPIRAHDRLPRYGPNWQGSLCIRALLLRTVSFAAIIACSYAWLWTPFRLGYSSPMRLQDFILCVVIQTSVPLFVWILLCVRPTSRGMQVAVTLLWTWLASSSLVLLAGMFHDSSVYQTSRPWDYLLREGGIMIYLPLVAPIFSVIAAALTLIPFARKPANDSALRA